MKNSEIRLQLELKNIKNDIFENFKKLKNYLQKHPKTSKSHVRRPHVKKSENRIKLTFKYIMNDIFKSFKTQKIL